MKNLAINGGSKAMPEDIQLYDWPIVTDEDVAALQRVIDSREIWGKENAEV